MDYNDAQWDALLDQMSIDDLQQIIGSGGYQTAAVSSIEKVRTSDCDGPASINNFFTGVGSVGFPAAALIGMTWDKDQPTPSATASARWLTRWIPPAGTVPL